MEQLNIHLMPVTLKDIEPIQMIKGTLPDGIQTFSVQIFVIFS